jgi:hypothetical protein
MARPRKSPFADDVRALLESRRREGAEAAASAGFPSQSLLDEARARREAGERDAAIVLPKACKVISPRRPRGRPRVRPVGAKGGHGYRFRTIDGWPVRCRARGCQRQLRKNATSIVCSERCEEALRRECETMLAMLNGEDSCGEFIYYKTLNHKPWKRRTVHAQHGSKP